MQSVKADQKLVLTLLAELLSHREEATPEVPLQRYELALRTLVYRSPRQGAGYRKEPACTVLVEAMHQIYCKKAATGLLWLNRVEEATYDAYSRLCALPDSPME